MLKNIVKIQYNSDFTLNCKLPNGYDNQDFIIRLYTTDKASYFEASYLNGEYSNCLTDDNNKNVVIYVNNHGLQPGCLHVGLQIDYSNTHFTDNVENIITAEETNVYLVKQNANATSAMYVGSALPDLTGSSDFITESDLEFELLNYYTKEEIDNANYISSADLNDYVTEEELNDMGFLSAAQLDAMGYTTKDYVDTKTSQKQDRLISAVNIKTVNGYSLLGNGNINISGVSQDDLDNAIAPLVSQEALTETLSYYVSHAELNSASYATQSFVDDAIADAFEDSDFMTETDVNNLLSTASYLTSSELSSMGYITNQDLEQTLSNATYVTSSELSNAGYVTVSEISSMGYATETYVSDYVAQHAPTPDLSAYVTKTELNNASYVTESQLQQAGYVTATDLNNASYATTSQLSNKQDTLVSGTNIKTINNESLLGSGDITIQSGSSDYTHVLTFTAKEANSTVSLVRQGTDTNLTNVILEYSIDNGNTWNDYTLGNNIILANINDNVKFKGINNTIGYNDSNYHYFIMTGKISASGDITSLINGIGGDVKLLYNYEFTRLFYSCSSLISAPNLPSTTLSSHCYEYMFGSNNSSQAPRITICPQLPATNLASYCYYAMFHYCTALVTTTELPATKLSQRCYIEMFYGCTSLTSGPKILPATTLAAYCYNAMFYGCTSLVTAPILPANTITGNCYDSMFSGCTNLKYIKAALMTNDDYYGSAFRNWVTGVSSTGVMVIPENSTFSKYVPTGWTVYRMVSIDTDDLPESYIEDEGKTLQVVNGVWTKVVGGGSSTQEQADWNETDSTYASYILNKPDLSNYVTQTDLSNMSYATTSQLSNKQDTLVSGTNIKTVNNNSLLGSGNITISSSGNIIAEVTQAEYDAMQQAGTLDPNTIYVITDAPATDLSYYAELTYVDTYYVSKEQLNSAGYLTSIPNTYATYAAISNMGYVTQTNLSNAGYLTSIPNTYATYTAISNMGYLTSANFIYNSSTYTLTINI